jgi:phosphatidylethanolamine-binding protein (PEBP) family uncharacterized protein
MRAASVSLIALVSATACGGSDTPTTVRLTVPGIPLNLVATPGNQSATIAFTVPTDNGGSPILSYTVTCNAAGIGISASKAAGPITVTGLTNGVSYLCAATAANAQGTGPASVGVAVTPTAPASSSFTVASPVVAAGGLLPAAYTCDGAGSTLALTWSGAPAGTKEYAVLMTTLPGDGTTKWNWVLYGIPAATTALARDAYGVGTLGVGSDGPLAAYQPPCSQGPGSKTYTYTVYALSGPPSVTGTPSGATLAAAIAPLTLASAVLNVSYARLTYPAAAVTNCGYIRGSLQASTTALTSIACDSTYAYVNTNGLAGHQMMNGITATNLQVPLAQNFFGANAWRIPLAPAIAATTTSVDDGPIGMAVNGVPIFNPCKQGGCQNGDTKVLGELDDCNGHAGRADDYHYHAAPTCLMATRPASYWDTHPVGWALDGFAIFGFNDATGTVAVRDNSCGGNTSTVPNAPSGYSYHVTNTAPYVLACLRGVPSPDLAGQGAKYKPIRQPPVTPFAVTNMTLANDPTDGYDVLQFTSGRTFVTTENGTDSYSNAAGTYRIRYKALSGSALTAALATAQNAGKSACWSFQFQSSAGATTQPTINYCR